MPNCVATQRGMQLTSDPRFANPRRSTFGLANLAAQGEEPLWRGRACQSTSSFGSTAAENLL